MNGSKDLTRIPHMDFVDVPERCGDPGENANSCFHPSHTLPWSGEWPEAALT